ncbi:hypothetical protein AB9K35_17380 [Leisingera sp. XS_AS12]|uniref:hypothetical protein n=1 Tax=Leisingera sp. XS_AS12 TaxID=3241294 RepID=UPI00351413E9
MDWAPLLLTGLAFAAIPEDDKKMHFAAGAAIAKTSEQVFELTPLQACGVALAAGVAKEAYDRSFGGNVEGADALATMGGCMITFRF